MLPLVRTTSVWVFAAFFGGISLLGPGWHCVFGRHFHGSAACDHGHAHTHSQGREHVPAAACENAIAGSFVALADADHDCPLCQFFGAAQWAEVFSLAELVQLPRELAAPAEAALRLTFVSLYQSRGPPLGPAHV